MLKILSYILGFVVFGVILKILKEKYFPEEIEKSFPYKKKDYLLTVTERKFFDVLNQVTMKNNYHVFTKVRLEDLLWLPKYTKDRFTLRNKIKSRHIDFLLCDKENIRPLLAIELDDSSHEKENRAKIDDRKSEILKGAGLPLLRVKVRSYYDLEELFRNIKEKIIKFPTSY